MPRPLSPDLIAKRKISLPATLCGRVEYLLHDPTHNKPRYGALSSLVAQLLEQWVYDQTGEPTYKDANQ